MSQASTADAAHEAHDDHGHEVTPLSTYMKVYGALLVLTVLTVAVSFVDLGSVSFLAAMIVAVAKAAVVAAYFMHLKYDDKLYTLAFGAGILFVALFFTFTYMDLFTRDDISLESDNYTRERDKNWELYINEGGEPTKIPTGTTTTTEGAGGPGDVGGSPMEGTGQTP